MGYFHDIEELEQVNVAERLIGELERLLQVMRSMASMQCVAFPA